MHTKIRKQLIALFLAAVTLMLPGLPAKAASEERSLVYTALGDSISTGYKLSNVSDSYVSLFGKYLNTTPANLGQNGLDSTGLLKKLDSDQKVIAQIKKSDIITVSMGGNDMLTIFANMQPTSFNSLLNDVKQFQGKSMQQKLLSGVDTFSKNWPKIIARLKELSPNATIVVTTLINPYQGIAINVPLLLNFDFGTYSDTYVKKINAVITKDASGNYLVADSYTLFKSHKNQTLTNADLSSLNFDPHPNVVGHNLIFKAHQSVKICFTHKALSLSGPLSLTLPSSTRPATARYSVQPLLSCFTTGSETPSITYSVESGGPAGTFIDSSTGELLVKNPGEVKIKAVLTMPQSNLSAEEVKTIRIMKPAAAKFNPYRYIFPAGAGCVLLFAAAMLILILKKSKRAYKGQI